MGFLGLRFGLGLAFLGCGGVFSIRWRTSSSVGCGASGSLARFLGGRTMQTFKISILVSGPIKWRIGEVCVQWSFLELQVERLIWHLSGLNPKEGRLITAREDITPRLKRLKKLAGEKLSETEAQAIRDLAGEIKATKKKRHFVVHGLYGTNAKDELHALTYREDPRKGKARPISETFLKELASQVRALTFRLQAMIPLR